MEDSEAVSTHRVSMIISELSYFLVFWAYARIGRWSNSMLLKIVPISVSVGTGCAVIDEVIVWIGDPETGWGLVGVEQTP